MYRGLNILWHCFSFGLEWKLIFSSPVATDEFSKFADILSAALSQHHLLGFLNSSTGIPSPPLALFIVLLPKAQLTSHSRMSGSRWVITPSWLSGSLRFLFLVLSVFLPSLLNIFLLLLGPYHFCNLLCPSFHEMFPWYLFKNFPPFVVIYTVKGFSVVNEAEDVYLEFSCFFHGPVDVGNLISGSSAFSKSSCTSGSSQFRKYWSLT